MNHFEHEQLKETVMNDHDLQPLSLDEEALALGGDVPTYNLFYALGTLVHYLNSGSADWEPPMLIV